MRYKSHLSNAVPTGAGSASAPPNDVTEAPWVTVMVVTRPDKSPAMILVLST